MNRIEVRRRMSALAGRVLLVIVMLGVALIVADKALAEPAQQKAIFNVGGDVVVEKDQRVQAVAAIGGDVTIAGTVDESVIAIGGNVKLLPTAVVGAQRKNKQDSAVVAVGGDVTREPGAQVLGTINRAERGWQVDLGAAQPLFASAHWSGPWGLAWLLQLAVWVVFGLVFAALMPEQMRAVGASLEARVGRSLGWGFAALGIALVAAILIALTIIGILLLIPLAIVAGLFAAFVEVAVAAWLAQKALVRLNRPTNSLMQATALGVVGLALIALIPVVGQIITLVVTAAGIGAAILALRDRRRSTEGTGPKDSGAGTSGSGPQAPLPPAPPAGTPSTHLLVNVQQHGWEGTR